MARVSSQDCLDKIPNHFAVCILGARRARELAAGRPSLVACQNKPAVTALREIAAGHVVFEGIARGCAPGTHRQALLRRWYAAPRA